MKNFRWILLAVATGFVVATGACTSQQPADAYKVCQKCDPTCKGPDGCPKQGACAHCAECGNRAYQCANCAKRVSTLKPCEQGTACHVKCKGCQWQGREGCDKASCECGKK